MVGNFREVLISRFTGSHKFFTPSRIYIMPKVILQVHDDECGHKHHGSTANASVLASHNHLADGILASSPGPLTKSNADLWWDLDSEQRWLSFSMDVIAKVRSFNKSILYVGPFHYYTHGKESFLWKIWRMSWIKALSPLPQRAWGRP